MILLDSCILIDISRQKQPALDFILALDQTPSLSVVTLTEVLRGVRSTREEALFDRLFQQWHILPTTTTEIAILAADHLKRFGSSHGMDIIDAIIAATAQHHKVDFATLNIKHFPMFPGLQRPY